MDDIQESAERAVSYLDGVSQAEFEASPLLQDAVIRCLTVIGEAVAHLPGEETDKFPELPWREMKAMRNIVVHEYFGVALRTVWITVQQDLPPLIEALRRLQGQ